MKRTWQHEAGYETAILAINYSDGSSSVYSVYSVQTVHQEIYLKKGNLEEIHTTLQFVTQKAVCGWKSLWFRTV